MPPLVTPVTFDLAVIASVSVLPPEKFITSCKSYIEPKDVLSNNKPFPSSSNISPLSSSCDRYTEPFELSIVDTIPKTVAVFSDTPSLSTNVANLLNSNSPLCSSDIETEYMSFA